ncbi:hypothetical protein [Salimicrobium halophilum]|uniref:Uncharacterized protein n=1 Tax=Salimicrobium halophilum TaxID=86666 RepID=A0A1G8QBB4_9BACI|nr:hypothetical protein [Salimicrobium halophilum]SDJ01390.1 hypothetical protein SAMN04490247_0481 [Salimicrobium halophilum]
MIGSIRWNVWIAVIASLGAFLISLRVNPADTSLWRGGIAFLILFLAVFIFRAVLSFAGFSGNEEIREGRNEAHEKAEELSSDEDSAEGDAEATSKVIRELMNEENERN